MWSSTFNFVLAVLIFVCNVLVLVAVSGDPRLHTPFHLLSTNLWLCNSISAVVTIFFSLSRTTPEFLSPPCPEAVSALKGVLVRPPPSVEVPPSFGPHSTAVLLNSTVSLLSLLAIGVVHALYTHNYRLSKSQSSRVLASTWFLALVLLATDFVLLRLGRSSVSVALPFHLALLSMLLLLNLLLHPTNLVVLSRCSTPPSQEAWRSALLEESITAALWLLLNSLSFVIIAMMVVWDVRNGKDGSEHVLGIEMAAYSVHCVANPLIAIIRDRRLEVAIARLLRPSKRQPTLEDDLVIALMRDPPPPYSI